MSLSKFKDIETFELDKIEIEIIELKKQLFELRIKKGTRQTFKPHLFKSIQRKIKQLAFLEYKKVFDITKS